MGIIIVMYLLLGYLIIFFAHMSMPATVPQLEHSLLQSLLLIHSEIADLLAFEDCVQLIELVQILKPTIILSLLPHEAGPLDRLRRPVKCGKIALTWGAL